MSWSSSVLVLSKGYGAWEGVVESAYKVLEGDGAKEGAWLVGEIMVSNPLPFFDFWGDSEYDG
jgi:hypothetical protein